MNAIVVWMLVVYTSGYGGYNAQAPTVSFAGDFPSKEDCHLLERVITNNAPMRVYTQCVQVRKVK